MEAAFAKAIAKWTKNNTLFDDLSKAKSIWNGEKTELSDHEWLYLRGILERYKPTEIAKCCDDLKNAKAVVSCLTEYIYNYVEELFLDKKKEELRLEEKAKRYRYRIVRSVLLDDLGYQPDSLPEKIDLTSDLENKSKSSLESFNGVASYWSSVTEKEALFGREQDLENLKQWVLQEQLRVIPILGVPWIGKTTLARHFATFLKKEHGYKIFWFQMDDTPLLKAFIHQLHEQWGERLDISNLSTEKALKNLLDKISTTPWLIILDRMESVIKQGQYLESHENYENLFEQICQRGKNGCVLVTTSKAITHLEFLENYQNPVRTLHLEGILPDAIEQLLMAQGVKTNNPEDYATIYDAYSGRPGFVCWLARHYKRAHDGNLVVLNEWKTLFLDDIMRRLLKKQWQQLSENEQYLLQTIKSCNNSVSLQELYRTVMNRMSHTDFNIAYQNLQYELLIRILHSNSKEDSKIILEPLIAKYF